MNSTDALILAAGKGTRMHSAKPKVLHTILGETMLSLVSHAAASLPQIAALHVVAGHQAEQVFMEAGRLSAKLHHDVYQILQKEQKGTGHALMTAMPSLRGRCGSLLVLNGDAPLVTSEVLDNFMSRANGADIAFLTLYLDDAASYGRVMRKGASVHAIVEAKDFDPEVYGPLEDAHEVNSGIYYFSLAAVEKLLPQLSCSPKSGEYYITDLIGLGVAAGMDVRGILVDDMDMDARSLLGVNTPAELAVAESLLREQTVRRLLEAGVVIHSPESVCICPYAAISPGAEIFGPAEIYGDSSVGENSVIRSHCVMRNCIVHAGAEIREFTHMEEAQILPGAIVGPFARLRSGSIIDENAHVGDFVELKKTHLGKRSKANHLAYLGDSEIGEDVNIGAGTITCNYDGRNKHKTLISDGCFIGSNTSLVAPVMIGPGSLVGAGSVITKNVPADSLAVARKRQENLPRKKK